MATEEQHGSRDEDNLYDAPSVGDRWGEPPKESL
jgi:hypothetical protein